MSHDKANAMILAQDLHRDTPLMLAVGRGHSGHVKLILDHLNEEWEAGITDPATQLFMHHSINLHGDTLLHKAAKLGKPRVMSELMDWMERVLVLVNNNGLKTTMTSWFNHQNQNGDTAMHVAARLGHNYNIQNLRLRSQTVDWRDPTECIRLLLGGGGRRRRSGDKEGEEGDLVKSDATADAELENRSGDTPLEIAVREGDEEMLDVFRAANARYADLIQTMKEEAEGMLGDENDEGEGGDWDDSESGEVTTKSTDSRRSSISRDSDDLDKVILNLEE